MIEISEEPTESAEALQLFRDSVRAFLRDEWVPQQSRWRVQHRPDAEAWTRAGAVGLLLPDVPEIFGGGGGTFAHEAVVLEELARAGVAFGNTVQSVVAHYLLAYGTDEQKRAWLPRMARGDLVAAMAMTEPDAGSDLQGISTSARRDGDAYVINGSKTFVTNGWHAGLICVVVKTTPGSRAPRSLSLIMVETERLAGYRVGRTLAKIGRQGQDTCELSFDDVRVPAANLLGGTEGAGFAQLMEQLPYERLSVAVSAAASAEEAVASTIQYTKERSAFGKPLFEMQNTRFVLAQCHSDAQVGRAFVDRCVQRFVEGRLDPTEAAMAKYWLTDCEHRVADACLQLHGGYGYMDEYPIAHRWADSRVQRIYSGANELMKEIIAWSL
ncbi:MAG TPA: acyl-CoA dehydrogenase family protein [Gemmatimonadaceae bacterium]|nr:acyl-CoA dehydrogenase family protein [Gemmatimonadaceae bacterium]